MKQKLIQIVLVLIIIIGLGFVVKEIKPKKMGYDLMVVDVKANKVFLYNYSGAGWPVKSRYSDGKNAWPAMKCARCGKIFAVDDQSFSGTGQDAHCPYCGYLDIRFISLKDGAPKPFEIEGPVLIERCTAIAEKLDKPPVEPVSETPVPQSEPARKE